MYKGNANFFQIKDERLYLFRNNMKQINSTASLSSSEYNVTNRHLRYNINTSRELSHLKHIV